jgi:hypothetical protein
MEDVSLQFGDSSENTGKQGTSKPANGRVILYKNSDCNGISAVHLATTKKSNGKENDSLMLQY